MWPALALILLSLAPAGELEAFFEVKLLVRERVWGRRVEVDQWSGGRLLLRGYPAAGGAIEYGLERVLESPWTFRWYPTRNEVKLGAAVHVPEPQGHAYGALAPKLEPLATERYTAWWDADPAAAGPPWAEETGRFWSAVHAKEAGRRDALPPHPTYPFHVLGPLDGRFGFTLREGELRDVVERMTQPWLVDGWRRALAGESVRGYGFWEAERPSWEPRVYETFAAALSLLDGDADSLESRTSEVLAAMQPLTRRLGRQLRGLRWRHWQRRTADSGEIQVLVDSPDDGSIKAWVRAGYRAAPRRTP